MDSHEEVEEVGATRAYLACQKVQVGVYHGFFLEDAGAMVQGPWSRGHGPGAMVPSRTQLAGGRKSIA